MRRPTVRFFCLAFLALGGVAPGLPHAEPVYHPSGPRLTFGGMTQRQQVVSSTGNPAQSYPVTDGDGRHAVGFSGGLGIEYEANDEFFDLLDRLGRHDALAPPGGGGGGSGGGGGGGAPGGGIGDIIDPLPEEIQAIIDEIYETALLLGGLIVVAAADLNAKAFTTFDLPLTISRRSWGGTWTFDYNHSIITNLRGLSDPIEFDPVQARGELESFLQTPPTEVTTYDLSGGARVTVDPDTGKVTFTFENDSSTITRTAQVREFAVGYSRRVWSGDEGRLYVGLRPRLVEVGLSNAVVPIAQIDRARDIFDALDPASFVYEKSLTMDLGMIWRGPRYQLGATLTNLHESEFRYPSRTYDFITSRRLREALADYQTYTMERQFKLEAGVISPSGAWGLSLGYDANAVPDPMGDDYRWLSLGAGFAAGNWWLPGARLGVRHNLAGTGMTYLTLGLTLFNVLNLDLASTTQTIRVSGTTIPQGMVGNLSVQFVF